MHLYDISNNGDSKLQLFISRSQCRIIYIFMIFAIIYINLNKNNLTINKNKISFSQETNLENIDWNKFDVDYVFECTGKFNSKEKLIRSYKKWCKKSYCFCAL